MTDLLAGDLLFTRSEGIVGSLIRFGARVRYYGWFAALGRACSTVAHRAIPEEPGTLAWGNHIAVHVGGGVIIEALADGLTRGAVSRYDTARWRVLPLTAVRPDVTEGERAALVAYATGELGRHDRYGWLAIASIIVQLLTPTKLDVGVDGAMICSAFGARCWEHAGVFLATENPMTTMPADLAVMAGARP